LRLGHLRHLRACFAGLKLAPSPAGDVDHGETPCQTRTAAVWNQAAVYGLHLLCELITPQAFEAAVVFERPRWPLLNSERRVMRYALKQIEAGGGRPSICDNGRRIEWRIAEPKIGARYMCVAFHQNGLLLWNDTLQKHSLAGRMRRLVGRFAPG
jgi:hypothetical protein